MDETQSASPQPSFFKGTNKLLVMLLGIFVIIIIAQLGYYFFIQKPQNAKRADVTANPAIEDIFAKATKEKTLGELSYEQIKAQVPKGTIQESRFQGKIVQLNQINGGLEMELESLVSNSMGTHVWYRYTSETVIKITITDVEKGMGTKLSLDNLAVGDSIYIDETNDYSKDYPQSLTQVIIRKI